MGEYIYQHPKSKKTISVIQRMTEEHVYIDKKGVKWNRLFTIPQAQVKDKEPTNAQEFSEYTKKRKGSMGNLYDQSKELSEKRKERSADGIDPIKKKYWKDYSKKRRGKRHPEDRLTNL